MSRVGDPDVAIWFGMLVFKMHVWGCCGCCVGSSVLTFAPWSSTARDFSIGWLPEASLAWPSWCAHFRSCWWSSKACAWFWCCYFNLITWVLLEVLKLCWISQWYLWISLPFWERESAWRFGDLFHTISEKLVRHHCSCKGCCMDCSSFGPETQSD